MTPADDVIARAAHAIAPHFARNDVRWVTPGRGMCVPGEAEIALALKEMVSEIKPGQRIESGHLIVEWPIEDVEDDGEEEALAAPGPIRVLFHLAEIEPEDRTA